MSKKPQRITKKEILKFFAVLTACGLYMRYLILAFGYVTGIHVALLNWTFFILCTPTTNGGILIDIPFQAITGHKRVYSEIVLWLWAIAFNIISFHFTPSVYFKSIFSQLLYQIIAQPWPMWFIIGICGLGTFYSVIVSDMPRVINKKIHKVISKILTLISIIIVVTFSFQELIIVLNTHGRP